MIYFAITEIRLSILSFTILFISGVALWTLAEYLLHRFLFHWVGEAKWLQRFHFMMHGAHHEYPTDEERLLMPPVPGLIMASMLFLIQYGFFFIIGISDYTFGFFPGFFLGYLMYSFVHRATHVIRKPPKRYRKLWRHHGMHHYKYPNKAYGVSTMFWDRVFGTMPPKS